MRDLTGVLEREAGRVHPRPDLDDVLRRAGRRRRRRAATSLAGLVLALALGAAAVVRSTPGDDRIATAVDLQPVPVDVARLGGLVLTGAGSDISFRAGTLERKDAAAADGAWAVVLRRDGGDLVDGTVVVTYPWSWIPGPDGEVIATESAGVLQTRLTRWLGPDGRQQFGPDGRLQFAALGVSADELTQLADAVTVDGDRPVFHPEGNPGGEGWRAVATGPLRAPLVAEARYGCDSLGEGEALGAMCYTGLTASPGFLAALLSQPYQAGPAIGGRPAVVSVVGGGSSTLAWELQPGVVAYVGYSGNVPGPDQIAALGRLAERTDLLDPDAWAATGPSSTEQENDWMRP